ncbi:MAG: PEP-CTERM sorting domain-containing protein [Pseudomonadota bacterium]|nr:PEP-CTERM sorting domain-containing protein [Pseudomonadota bacterium]
MKKQMIRTALAAALGCAATLASAGTVTLTDWTFGSGNTINVSNPAHNGPAGGFKGSLAGFGSPFDTASFLTYCVELTEYFSFSTTGMTNYSLVSGAGYGEWTHAATTSNRIGQLMSYVNANPTAVDTAAKSTSLQLAIWNSIYDTDNTLAGGDFKDTTAFSAYANTLLTDSLGTTSNLNVYVVTKAGSQDFLVTTAVPEPGTYALMMAGLAGMGFVARRRRVQR